MKQCPRCLKHTGEVGVHTCTPTEYARKLEAENAKLKQDALDIAALLDRMSEANGKIGAILTSTTTLLSTLSKSIKGSGL